MKRSSHISYCANAARERRVVTCRCQRGRRRYEFPDSMVSARRTGDWRPGVGASHPQATRAAPPATFAHVLPAHAGAHAIAPPFGTFPAAGLAVSVDPI